ncbi:MAG: isoleucine--tRNA ligase [Bacteroidota bacterium]|jgi:isoleucyl-tRNA synthetase
MSVKYPEYKQLNLSQIGKDVLKFWDDDKTFERSVNEREGAKPYVFYEGPPSANGMPGIHHVMARSIKDIFCRYKTLKGYQVKRKAGWDTHGLPIELAVEKTLGITKEDIGKKISVEEYNAACRREVMKYTDKWEELTRIMGYWVDMKQPYITYDNKYIESVWWLLKDLYKKNLLYKGYTIQPYSPMAGTGLSSAELNQPGCYKSVKDTSIVAQFQVTDKKTLPFEAEGNVCFLAWTTTPWTLPSNCALAVGEKIVYVALKTFNTYSHEPVTVILAKELMGSFFPKKNEELKISEFKKGDKAIPYQLLAEFTGKQIEGVKYEQLLPYVKPEGKAFEVIIGDFITTEDGTGIVHTASVFGADDFRACKQNGIVSILVKDEYGNETPLVDRRGRFVKEMADADWGFAGEYVKAGYYNNEQLIAEYNLQKEKLKKFIPNLNEYLSVDDRIALKLKLEGKAFKIEKYEHNYPHCWRTDVPILYYPLDSWFVKVSDNREKLVELNKKINWKPEATGSGRFGNWLENALDWNLSRSRYWGIPLPIWRTEDGTEEKCIGSLEELKLEIEKAKAAGIISEFNTSDEQLDLHKPYIDQVFLISDSGKKMIRENDLIDVWFDSGAMPYAQLHYPFENKELIDDKKYYPADFIAEGVDQTRGWFYTLHVIAALCFDSVAYKNVVSNGLVLDKHGRKMSKRLGNAVDPFETIEKYGPDATRWYMVSNAAPWDELRFNTAGIEEVQRKFFGTLYNTYNFYALYANVDGFSVNPENMIPVSKRSELDRWILSKLQNLVAEATNFYEDYEPHRAARLIEEFVDEHLSNWYVRLSRRVFWKGQMGEDKQAAYETLHQCLTTVAQLMSPVAPFFADWLYRNLNFNSGSVHITSLKDANKEWIDSDLEYKMFLAQKISSMVLSIRKKENIRVRQPLEKIQIPVVNDHQRKSIEAVKELILAEVNVKRLEFADENSVKIVKNLKLNFKTLGKKCGQNMKAVQAFAASHQEEIIKGIEKDNEYVINLDSTRIVLQTEDVEIIPVDIPGWKVVNHGNLTVSLDITLTEALIQEGISRELVNRIQNIRKDKGFELTDRIHVKIERNTNLVSALQNNMNYICNETLCDKIEFLQLNEMIDPLSVELEEGMLVGMMIDKINN